MIRTYWYDSILEIGRQHTDFSVRDINVPRKGGAEHLAMTAIISGTAAVA